MTYFSVCNYPGTEPESVGRTFKHSEEKCSGAGEKTQTVVRLSEDVKGSKRHRDLVCCL